MTNPAQFDAAVNAAERWLREEIGVGRWDPFVRVELGEWKLGFDLGILWFPADKEFPQGYFKCSDEAASDLFNMCEKDPAAWDLCKKIAMHRFLTQDHLPAPLREFIYAYMAGILNEPPRRRQALTWMERATIYVIAHDITAEFELTLTRNDEPAGHCPGYSACDAMVQALGRCDFPKSYRAIKEICVGKAGAQMRKELEEGFAALCDARAQSR